MGGGTILKNFYFYIILNSIFVVLLNSTVLFAQFEDDEFDLGEEDEVVCAPESVLTVYDSYDFTGVSFDQVRQWYSFGSEYHKNKNYKSYCLFYSYWS